MTETLRYARATLYADYARTGFGILVFAGLPLAFHPALPVTVGCAVVALLFAAFGLRTLRRQLTEYRLSEEALEMVGPFGARIGWQDLNKVSLRYYSTRRDRGRGWMQLTIKGQGCSVRMESTIDRFDEVAERAARAARERGLALDRTTLDNLAHLGIDTGGPDRDGR